MFWRDWHLAWRSALRNPGYSFLIVAVLAIGIGANTAIFGLANAAFFRALPGVSAVGSTSNVLFPNEMYKVPFVIWGREAEFATQSASLPHGEATPDFFRAMGIPLLRGRFFTDADAVQSGEQAAVQVARNEHPAAIINETMAHRYWPNDDPIGKRIKFADPNFPQPWQTIVGVVGDVHQEGLEKSPGAMAYVPSSGYYGDDLVVRSTSDAKTLLAAIKSQVTALDKNSFVDHFAAVSEILSAHESQRKFNAWLLGAFAFIALLLAAVGIYGSISYWVKQRTQEIGVRMALGAQPRNILALVIGRGMAIIFVGLVLGVAGALTLTRLLSSMLFGVKPADPLTYTAVALLLAAVAFAACYFPARRAMDVDPLVALRYE
ncbi:MAG: FtsX-like permease family protein [Candidatus Acidiferrales bacterium]